MLHAGPAPALNLLFAGADVVIPALVVPENGAIRVGHPGQLRDGVGERPELLFALAELLRPLLDALLELAIELLELPRLAMQLGEDADFGAQQLRHDGDGDIVD